MSFPKQNGPALKVIAEPTFTDIIITDGSWKPTDNSENSTLKASGVTFHSTWTDPGFDIAFQGVIKSTSSLTGFRKGDVLTTADTPAVKYEVMDATPSNIGEGKPAVWDFKLRIKDGQTLS